MALYPIELFLVTGTSMQELLPHPMAQLGTCVLADYGIVLFLQYPAEVLVHQVGYSVGLY